MTERVHLNNFDTTLNSGITNVATTMTLVDASDLPTDWTDTVVNLTLIEGSNIEIVTATTRTGNNVTMTRAQEGTSGIAFSAGAAVQCRTTADSLDRKIDLTSTQSIDLSGAEDLKIPIATDFAAAAAGEIGIDSSITGHTGLIKYHDGTEELSAIAIPTANLTAVEGDIISYDATADEFKMAPPAGGGGGGLLVQNVYSITSTESTHSVAIPWDNTIPQITEGGEAMTVTITPTSATNLLEIQFDAMFAAGASQLVTLALFQDSTADAIQVASNTSTGAGNTFNASLRYIMVAGTTSATTFKLRFGHLSATACYFLGVSKFGAANKGVMSVKEITV